MDQNPQGFDEKKKEIINKLTGLLIDSLIKEETNREDGQTIAGFILEKKDQIKDGNTLADFLNELATKWPIYNNFYDAYKKTEQVSIQDKQKLDLIKNQLDQLSKNSS